MRRNHFIIFFTALFLSYISNAFASTGPAAFLDIGVGSRARAMGSAFCSVADDATAAYWNPAGLGYLKGYNAVFMTQTPLQSEWPGLEDMAQKNSFAGVTAPLGLFLPVSEGQAALSFISYSIDKVPYTYLNSAGRIMRETFKNSENALMLSAGYPLYSTRLMLGATVKYIWQNMEGIDNGSAWGVDTEVGIIIRLSRSFRFGLLADKGAELYWKTGHMDKGLLTVRTGVSYDYMINSRLSLLSSIDFIQRKSYPLKSSGGLEFKIDLPRTLPVIGCLNSIALRAGVEELTIENRYGNMKHLNSHIDVNLGAGMVFSTAVIDFIVDYDFSLRKLGDSHLITLSIKR